MPTSDMLLRRRAVEIVTQLPENTAEARTVLTYVRQLLDGFLSDQAASGGSRPNLRAISNESEPVSFSSIQPTDSPGICLARD